MPCPGHSVPSSLPVTQQESSCGQSETASLCPHTCPQKTSHLHTQAKKKKKMWKSDGLFECTQTTKREGQLFCLFHKIGLVRPSSLKSSLLISTPPRSVLCVLLGKKHVLFIRMRLRGHCGNSRWMHPM